MRGHKALVAMRLKGRKPAMVWFDADYPKLPMADDWQEDRPDHAHLQIDRHENVETLDLRCLVGLTVFVDGQDVRRVVAVRDACIKAGAERVIAYAPEHITDTSEAFCG